MRRLIILNIFLSVLAIVGTGFLFLRTQETKKYDILPSDTIQATLETYIEKVGLGYSVKDVPLIFDLSYFYRHNRNEISKTLEIVDVVECQRIGVAFMRYSIGTDIFREVVWFKKINDKWTICLSPSFYAFSDDPFLDGKPERAKEIIERAEKWKNESHNW